MSSRNRNEPDDDYFNDLSKQPNRRKNDSPGSSQGTNDAQNDVADGGVPRTKRIACVICRKRKLKCDGVKPSCGTCARLKHSCSYDEVRRKSGPKRGYVKELETRLGEYAPRCVRRVQEGARGKADVDAMYQRKSRLYSKPQDPRMAHPAEHSLLILGLFAALGSNCHNRITLVWIWVWTVETT